MASEKGPWPSLFLSNEKLPGGNNMISKMPFHKYRPFPPMHMPDRSWPGKQITHAPLWCSVDLRDGNQALIEPMTIEKKWEMFQLLVEIGFKDIEVGFPSASRTEYDFLRFLIEEDRVPEDVTIQVLTQAREHLIKKTFEALRGARRTIVHLYNSTSILQRRVVFRMNRQEIKGLAVSGARVMREEAERQGGTGFRFEYTPESFTGTEPEYAVEICDAVLDVWEPSEARKVILNLPSTVEMATPNVYADQVEWFCNNISRRDSVIVSTHAHNDRGTAVAATELSLMAGAERVEGTLFGNGERTGNVDIITLALNLHTQGIDPMLDLSGINRIISTYKQCTNIPVHIRHPYAGALVYTSFSGSHQDAINKGLKAYKAENNPYWEVPYLPIDPADVGRTYESVIRINSQSGKGGVAHVIEREYNFCLPKEMYPHFGGVVQAISDAKAGEVTPAEIMDAFECEYLKTSGPYEFKGCRVSGAPPRGASTGNAEVMVSADVGVNGNSLEITGIGNGPIDAFCNSLKKGLGVAFRISAYHEHALEKGSDSKAVAYIRLDGDGNEDEWGVGIDTNIHVASFRAILSALNRSMRGTIANGSW
jgi:2-isopropylmalate synthase